MMDVLLESSVQYFQTGRWKACFITSQTAHLALLRKDFVQAAAVYNTRAGRPNTPIAADIINSFEGFIETYTGPCTDYLTHFDIVDIVDRILQKRFSHLRSALGLGQSRASKQIARFIEQLDYALLHEADFELFCDWLGATSSSIESSILSAVLNYFRELLNDPSAPLFAGVLERPLGAHHILGTRAAAMRWALDKLDTDPAFFGVEHVYFQRSDADTRLHAVLLERLGLRTAVTMVDRRPESPSNGGPCIVFETPFLECASLEAYARSINDGDGPIRFEVPAQEYERYVQYYTSHPAAADFGLLEAVMRLVRSRGETVYIQDLLSLLPRVGDDAADRKILDDFFQRRTKDGVKRGLRDLKVLLVDDASDSSSTSIKTIASSVFALQGVCGLVAIANQVKLLVEALAPYALRSLDGAKVFIDSFVQHLVLERPFVDKENLSLQAFIVLLQDFLSRILAQQFKEGVRDARDGDEAPVFELVRPSFQSPFESHRRVRLGLNAAERLEADQGARVWPHAQEVRFGSLRLNEFINKFYSNASGFFYYQAPAWAVTQHQHDRAGERLPIEEVDAYGKKYIFKKLDTTSSSADSCGVSTIIEDRLPVHDVTTNQRALVPLELSVSAFEDLIFCPQYYYLSRERKIRPLDAVQFELQALSRGVFIHSFCEKFMRAWLVQGAHTFEKVAVLKLAERLFEKEKQNWLRQVTLVDVRLKRKRSMTEAFLMAPLKDQLLRFVEWQITYQKNFPETALFSVEEKVEYSLKEAFGFDVVLRGKVDRMDWNKKAGVFSVIDYKTGQSKFIGRQLLAGFGAQLLVYSLAAERLTKMRWGAAYYLEIPRSAELNNKAGLFSKETKGILHDAHARNSGLTQLSLQEIMLSVKPLWQSRLQALTAGIFKPDPAEGVSVCATCYYQNLCPGVGNNAAD